MSRPYFLDHLAIENASPHDLPMGSVMRSLYDHLASIETSSPECRAQLLARKTAIVEAARRQAFKDLEENPGNSKPAPETQATSPGAPAILRPRAEMQAAERIEMGLGNYKGLGKATAFFDWVNPDGTAKEGDSRVLETLTVDDVVAALGSRDKLVAALRCMEHEPELTLGPTYGKPELDFIAMVIAMNRTQGKTPQRTDAYVNPAFGVIDPKALEGQPIKGYRPALIDGVVNPAPYLHDTPHDKWYARLHFHREFLKKKPVTGTDRLSYADLMALKLAAQNPADSNVPSSLLTYTIFDADQALTSSRIPYGIFDAESGENNKKPSFIVNDLREIEDRHAQYFRFRSVLRGNVLRKS